MSGRSGLWFCLHVILAIAVVCGPAGPRMVWAMTSIVVDYATGEVLTENDPDEVNYPASLTKMMTLYMAFEALREGRIQGTTLMRVSAAAAAMPPSKLGLRAGNRITVDDAINALAVKSANDAAVVLAEHIGGSEARFVQLMNRAARQIGLRQTWFMNASGLPSDRQRTTARDMATLARQLIAEYPDYYDRFGQHYFTWHGRSHRNHNRLLFTYDGMDGLKTGYIRAAGYNLAASAVRRGRRIIGVVLGGSTSNVRNDEMERILDEGFSRKPEGLPTLVAMRSQRPAVMDIDELEAGPPATPLTASPKLVTARAVKPLRTVDRRLARQKPARKQGEFVVQLGAFRERGQAIQVAQRALRKARTLREGEIAVSRSTRSRELFVAQIVGLERSEAQHACSTLRRLPQACLVMRSRDREIGSN